MYYRAPYSHSTLRDRVFRSHVNRYRFILHHRMSKRPLEEVYLSKERELPSKEQFVLENDISVPALNLNMPQTSAQDDEYEEGELEDDEESESNCTIKRPRLDADVGVAESSMKKQNDEHELVSPKKEKEQNLIDSDDNCEMERKVLVAGSDMMERGLSVLESGLWADSKFIIGEEKEEINVCSAFLSVASPVFQAMFFGSLAKKQPITILDVKPTIFAKLMQYIYCHSTILRSVSEAIEVCEAADKYRMPDLVDKCVIFITNSLMKGDMKLLCSTLNIATLCNSDELKKGVLQEVQDKIQHLLESPELLRLSAESMVFILRTDSLDVKSELELVTAAVRWAMAQCVNRELSSKGSNVRAVLNESKVLQNLRFLALTQRELEDGPLKLGILTEKEMTVILKNRHKCTDTPLPPFLCPIPTDRITDIYMRDTEMDFIRLTKVIKRFEPGNTTRELYFNEGDSLVLLGITLPTQIDNSRSDMHLCKYDEDIKVTIHRFSGYVCKKSDVGKIYATGFYGGKVKYNSEIYIKLQLYETRCGILENGDKFRVSVKFHRSGNYPLFTQISNKVISLGASGVVIGFTTRKPYLR